MNDITISPLLVVFEVFCFVLFYTTFCRLVKLNKQALLIARLAYFSLGGVIVFCMYVAAFKEYTPSGPDCLLLVAFTLVQLISSRAWKGGYPAHLSSRPAPLDEAKYEVPHHPV